MGNGVAAGWRGVGAMSSLQPPGKEERGRVRP